MLWLPHRGKETEFSMRLACLQENLKRGLALAGHAVAGRSSSVSYTHLDVYKRQGTYRDKCQRLNCQLAYSIAVSLVRHQSVVVVEVRLIG